MHGESKCIYYGDCPFSHSDCQEDEPHYLCQDRKVRHGESKSEWQPIETAAKNPRERILLFFPKFAGVQIGWFSAQEGWIDVSGPFGRSTPTHWMPLPAPPKGDK